ncbi:hypothetical protein tb265_15230 [Gemmatimonadetes bacterium T265]|nr:hypothetical protein tb265_15230 [Gemmatimonadetes bacterium T265]
MSRYVVPGIKCVILSVAKDPACGTWGNVFARGGRPGRPIAPRRAGAGIGGTPNIVSVGATLTA